jgi:ADP-heptose:LPS heptosyltransferase
MDSSNFDIRYSLFDIRYSIFCKTGKALPKIFKAPMANERTMKLLIVHQGALGDFVAIFPAIIRLKKYYRCIDVLCQTQLGKMAKKLGLVKQCYPLEAAAFALLYTNETDHSLAELLRQYAKIVVFSRSRPLEKSLNRMTGHRCLRLSPQPPAEKSIHITTYAIQNLVREGLLGKEDADLTDSCFSLHPQENKKRPIDRKKILIHPGSGSIRKRWPISQFKQIESVLQSKGLKPEFVLGPAELDLANQLAHQDRTIHSCSDLLDLVSLYKSAGGYIGNDSGASHLSAFMGLPTVVIFGPADPARWKPNGPFVEIIRPELECLPCFETDASNCPEPKCLDDTIPQAVMDAFYRIYN